MKIASTLILAATFISACGVKSENGNSKSGLESISSSVYIVNPMVCSGKIDKRPTSMHPDYAQILMKLVSTKTKKRDGTTVDTLVVTNKYFNESKTIDENVTSYDEKWYMGPLSIADKNVSRKSLSGRGDDLELKITKIENSGGKKVTTLEGSYSPIGTVVGSYRYNLTCSATN